MYWSIYPWYKMRLLKLQKQGFLLVKLKSSLWKCYSRYHDLVDCYGISVTNDHGYVPLVVNMSRSFPRSWLITGFVTRLTRSGAGTVYPSGAPEFTPGFWWGSCYLIFSFICMFCRLLFVLLYFFFQPLCCLFFFDIRILIFLIPLWYLQTLLTPLYSLEPEQHTRYEN